MPKTESLECSLCEETLVDGDRYVRVVVGAINPWHDREYADEPGTHTEFENHVYHRNHPEVDALLSAYNTLRYGEGAPHYET